MTPHTEIERAELMAAAARERLSDTALSLKARLDPRTIARDAVDGIADSGERAVEAAVGAAKRNPGKIVGLAAAVVLLFNRRRLIALFRQNDKPAPPAKPATPRRVRPIEQRPIAAKRIAK